MQCGDDADARCPYSSAVMSSSARSPLGLIVTGLGITQIVGWGTTFYIPAVLAGRIGDDTGWSLTTFVAAFSWCMLVSGLLSKRLGVLIDRVGARAVMPWGSVALAAGLLLVAVAHHEAVLFAGWTIIGIGMRAALYDAAFTALAHIAGQQARRAISIVTLWGGLASTVFWPLGHLLGEQLGWRWTLVVYALLNLLVCLPIHRRLPAHAEPLDPAKSAASQAPTHAATASLEAREGRFHGSERERAVLLLSAIFAGHALVWSAMSAHMIELLTGLGVTAGLAVSLSTVIGVAQVGSRLLEMFAQNRLAPLVVGVIAMAMLLGALTVFWGGPPGAVPLGFACIVYGAANGLVTIVRGALPLAVFGNLAYGATLGRIAAPGLVCSALGPVLFAWILERIGTRPAFGVLVAIACVSLSGMVWIAWRGRRSPAD